jgi:hypothetical protein
MAIKALGKLKTNGYETRMWCYVGVEKSGSQSNGTRDTRERQCRGEVGDIERLIARAVLWGVRSRELEPEAFNVSRLTNDPEGKRHMLFLSEYFGLLADRADLSKDRLYP